MKSTKWSTREIRARYAKGEITREKAVILLTARLREAGIGEDGIESMAKSMLGERPPLSLDQAGTCVGADRYCTRPWLGCREDGGYPAADCPGAGPRLS